MQIYTEDYGIRLPGVVILIGLLFYILGAAFFIVPKLAYLKYIIWYDRELFDFEEKIAKAFGVLLMAAGVVFMTGIFMVFI